MIVFPSPLEQRYPRQAGAAHAPVIGVSAYDDVPTRALARALGAVSFFREPVDDHALLDAIWWAISGMERG